LAGPPGRLASGATSADAAWTSLDQVAPHFISEADWHRIVEAVEGLTPEQTAQHRLLQPFERTRAILAILLEGALRSGELCRLDTSCLVATRDARSHAETHWLRVPVSKLENDRGAGGRAGRRAAGSDL
jgi:integrase